MPNWTWQMLDEAGVCFTNGAYNGCVLVLAAGVEHGLRELCEKWQALKLASLIREGVTSGKIKECEAKALRALKNYRNNAAHSNIDELARGKTFNRQGVYLTERGMMAASEWEEVEPVSQGDKEIAADLSAEREVGEILVGVRNAIHDIFDRHSLPGRN